MSVDMVVARNLHHSSCRNTSAKEDDFETEITCFNQAPKRPHINWDPTGHDF